MLPIGDDDSARRTFPGHVCLHRSERLVLLRRAERRRSFYREVGFRSQPLPGRSPGGSSDALEFHVHACRVGSPWRQLLYLWIFGDNVEDRFGHIKFIIFYLICGLAATFAQLAFSHGSNVPNLGASGAIAGVLGAYILLFPKGKVRVLQGQRVIQVPALIVIGMWIVLQFFSGIGSIANAGPTGGVAYMAHIGGFLAGFVLTFLFRGSRGAQAAG